MGNTFNEKDSVAAHTKWIYQIASSHMFVGESFNLSSLVLNPCRPLVSLTRRYEPLFVLCSLRPRSFLLFIPFRMNPHISVLICGILLSESIPISKDVPLMVYRDCAKQHFEMLCLLVAKPSSVLIKYL